MGDKKKDDGAGDHFKNFLEEALARKRNEMMDNFTQILRRFPIEKHLHQASMQLPSRYT
jgi:hypothetical protein